MTSRAVMKRSFSDFFQSLSDYKNVVLTPAQGESWAPISIFYRAISSRLRFGIGPKFFALFGFHRLPDQFWPTYILDEELRRILRQINTSDARQVINNKELFFEHCIKNEIPTIGILAKFVCGSDSAKICVSSLEHHVVDVHGHPAGHQSLFFKRTFGAWGKGSFIAERKEKKWKFYGQTGSLGDVYSVCDRLSGHAKAQWIVQPVIQTHAKILTITSNKGLSTVRVITILSGGTAMIFLAMLRITVGDNVTDNFSQGQSGNLVAPIDLASGRLGPCRGSATRAFPIIVTIERHPDTRNEIEGFRIPYWEETKSLVLRAHSTLPNLKTLAWDVAVTDSGPMIVEANGTYDVSGIQVAHQRGVKDDLLQLLEIE